MSIRQRPPIESRSSKNRPLGRSAPSARSGPEGSGGSGGIVLPMQLVYDGKYSVSYTIPLKFGTNPQTLSLQVDTGSSDLWVASSSCSTSPCKQAGGALYNGNSASQSGFTFNINYVAGSAVGPIVWDEVQLGGYEIDNQALAAVNDVEQEPLSAFSGVLGLALPANSVISTMIPPQIGNSPDGAVFASNLFTMGNAAPAARFLSISLERPGSDKVPSMFGIGRHPSEVISDPSTIKYSLVVDDGNVPLFWKATVSEIIIWVDGVRKDVELGPTVSGSALPTAIFDTGVPVILTTTAIANGIYGALGIGPAADGNYYVPCKTPINMTITVNGHLIALHPLDLTQSNDQSSDSCIGLIQNADPDLRVSRIGDMILGVPFMRNIYTVMAYTPPEPNGSFRVVTPSEQSMNPDIDPRLGLLNLTNSTVAMEEFNTVRVLGQPLSTGSNGGSGSGAQESAAKSHHGLSIGLKVFIGLISGFAFLVAVFLGRFLYQRRNWKKNYHKASNESLDVGKDGPAFLTMGNLGARKAPLEDGSNDSTSKKYTKRNREETRYTIDSATTRVEEDDDEDEMMMDEFGLVYFSKKGHAQSRSSGSFGWRHTLVSENDQAAGTHTPGTRGNSVTPAPDDRDSHRRLSSGGPQPSDPLLTSHSQGQIEWADSFPIVEASEAGEDVDGGGMRESMAGVGTLKMGRVTSDGFSAAAMLRLSSGTPSSPPLSRPSRSVRPNGPRQHTGRRTSDLLDATIAHENRSSLADSGLL